MDGPVTRSRQDHASSLEKILLGKRAYSPVSLRHGLAVVNSYHRELGGGDDLKIGRLAVFLGHLPIVI